MKALKLYTSVESACAQKVRLVLSEKQLDWEEQKLNLRRGDQFSADYLALNPKAVVPTLLHGDRVIRESSIIAEYLDDRFPLPALTPEDPYLRSRMRLWMKIQDDEVHPAIGVLTYAMVLRHQMNEMKSAGELEAHFQRMPDPKRRERQQLTHSLGLQSPNAMQALARMSEIISDMEQSLLHGEWLAGDHYSLADAALAPYIVRLDLLGFSLLLNQHGAVQGWLNRVMARENCQRLENPWGSSSFNTLVKSYARQSGEEVKKLLADLVKAGHVKNGAEKPNRWDT